MGGKSEEVPKSVDATSQVNTEPTTFGTPEPQSEGLLSRLKSILSRRKAGVSIQPQVDDSRRIANLEANKEVIKAQINSPDSTGSTKIQDRERLGKIEQRLRELRGQQPEED